MIVSPLANGSTRQTDSKIVLVEGVLDPAPEGDRMLIAPYHIHHSDEEIFYVLSGRIGFEIGEDSSIATAGDAVIVPAGSIHTWWNADPEPARYLITMSAQMDALILHIHERYRDPEEMAQLFADHDSTLIGWTR